ncbi:MAG: ferritin family protein [Deltaproteobacteria bacterium]|nr:MAG: ferritin family protein [Deltaproteobacteria bacterium]
MNFESLEEILNYAIEKEKEAAEFYLEISRQEPFAGAKQTFEEFAAQERKHQALLEDFEGNKEKIAAYKLKWIPDIKRSDYMVDMTYEKGMHYADILRLAMKREEKALLLYNEMQTKTQDEDYLKLFKILAQEEAKHKRTLETMYDDYMAEQGD